ncbi:lysA [Cordylochernes scorpioides]|uniref:LysA n=1 Tax=Cordylochernes scorpioides TaxID=51811 RepID=A0ABY6LT73_9ARAC|nr:lysA [Cordylochernes scorpioides]
MAEGAVDEMDMKRSMRDFLITYNKISEMCFMDCIDDFSKREVKSNEDGCAMNCIKKYLKVNERIGQLTTVFPHQPAASVMDARAQGGHVLAGSLEPDLNQRPKDHRCNIYSRDLASRYGTPSYVYSQAGILANLAAYKRGLDSSSSLLCFPVKSNGTLAILDLLHRNGSGFDVASLYELKKALYIGALPENIVFTGVGKSTEELKEGLDVGILAFHIESWQELDRLEESGTCYKTVPVSIRVNPAVTANTHPYVATGDKNQKFGVPYDEVEEMFQRIKASSNLEAKGIAYHVGSQILNLEPFLEARDKILKIVDSLRNKGITLEYVDVGGGIGIPYQDEDPRPDVENWVREIVRPIVDRRMRVIMEPGRSVLAEAGVLLTRVEYVKPGAEDGFTELLRPCLYGSRHTILPINPRSNGPLRRYNVVGPVCEASDFLALDWYSGPVEEGDVLAVKAVGAYGSAMASNFSARPRAPEIMVRGDKSFMIRTRETFDQLIQRDLMVSPEKINFYPAEFPHHSGSTCLGALPFLAVHPPGALNGPEKSYSTSSFY